MRGVKMREIFIDTIVGSICVSIEEMDSDTPIVFMHGMFLDKTLWSEYTSKLTEKTHIYIDMPAHGKSSDVGHDWDINNCVEMLIQILDKLEINKCFLIGQSWGSMTALSMQ